MNSQILFLGTGGDSIVVGKQYRTSGGIILNLNDMQFHLDPGPGALIMAKMYGINIRENVGVFVSHNHINHANDVNAVISAMTHNGLDKKGVLVINKSALYGTPEDSPFLKEFYGKCVEKIIEADSVNKLGIEDIDIRITKAQHGENDTVGFKFITKNFTISYASDTIFNKEIAEQYMNTDILILNVVYPGDTFSKTNLNTAQAIKFINFVKPRLAIITHFGIKMLQADPLYEAREIQKETKIHTIAAKDGMIINPQSFSSRIIQKTLKGY
ncbi:MBL fold metallo-hydrolase [archaeon]|jgi:ribonuclease BN (tRNA processing enzyme)|nr:MBL fold metallo-hydrolase [archaeon]MBT6821075.1 MBL fold metallo-hydrolase [archaeon]MBT7392068.1 MBL fold metallo-hydrolase [archaeon]